MSSGIRAAMRRQQLTPMRAGVLAAAASVAILASTYASSQPALALDILPPVAVPDTLTTLHDRTRVVPPPGVLANDLDLDGGSRAILVSGALHGSVTLRPDGGYTYTPTAGYVGSDEFRYRATSGLLTSLTSLPTTVSITVTDKVPDANPDEYTVVAGTTRFVAAPGVLANDTDPDGDELSAGLVTSVSHGSVSLATSGAFAYTPGTGYLGKDEFTYRAWDGAAWSKPTTVSLTVVAPATPSPTATSPPTPSPTPLKTPKPTPTPEPEPTPTPTPTAPPGSIVRPTPTSPPGAIATPTPRPTARSTPRATPTPTSTRSEDRPTPNVPGAGTTGSDEPGGPGNVTEPIGVRAVRVGLNDAVFGEFAGFGGIEWAVPALALGVPGLLLILALIAQGVIGVLWLAFARRRLTGLGVRRFNRPGPAAR
jgi:hypothetical protein